MRKLGLLMVFLLLAFVTQADLVDDFEGYSLGTPPDPWITSEDGGTFYAAIESDGSNQYVATWANGDYRDLRRPLAPAPAVDNTGVKTLYLRVMATDETTIDNAFGLTHDEWLNWYTQFGPIIRLIESGEEGTVELSARDDDTYFDDLAYLNVNQWYGIWLVIDCADGNGTYDLYYAAAGNAPVLARADNGFRTYYTEALDNFVTMMAGSSTSGNCRIDDIYIMDGEFLMDPKYVPLQYNSPAYGATLIPIERDASENDLVFEVIDPNIVDVEVYFGKDDPNTSNLIKTITSVGTGEQTVTLEAEWPEDLAFETDYYWKVIGYEPNTVSGQNDIPVPGPIWYFTTAPIYPVITQNPSPAYIAVDEGEPDIVLTANGINGEFRWYKDASPISDGDDYAGTTTKTLTIYDVQLADEGYYTFEIWKPGYDSALSEPARVMIHRQTSYYDFETIVTLPDSNKAFVDSIDGYHAVLMQEVASAGWPTSVSDANSIPGLGAYLYLNNEDYTTDPNNQYLQIYPGVVDYEDITVSMWAQSTAVAPWARLIDCGTGETEYMFITPDFGEGYDPRFAITTSGWGGEQLLQPDLGLDNWIGPGTGWHFIAVTISGDTGKMYIDGELLATNTGMTLDPINVGAAVNYIGKSQFDVDPEFSGYIDDLKIYNYARTSEQIALDYLAIGGDWICNNEGSADIKYDFDGNCRVDLADFALLAAEWLKSNRIYPE